MGECPSTQTSRTVTCPVTLGKYRIQPERTPHFSLIDRAAAAAAGLLRAPTIDTATGTGMEPLPATELAKYAKAHAWNIPGYEYEPQPPVTYTPAKADAAMQAEPELEPPIW